MTPRMSLIRYYDPATMRDRLEARDVSPEVTFTQELLDQADGERLIYDGETITVNVDNGKWIWRVVDIDHNARTVLGRWPD